MKKNKKISKKKGPSKNYLSLITIAVFGVLFLLYRYGFKERYFNVIPQTVEIYLAQQNKAVLIEKHAQQQKVQQLELSIRGNLSDNITLYLSPDGLNATSSIRLKKGKKINTAFITPWNVDKAYILIDNPNHSKNTLIVEYQFVASN